MRTVIFFIRGILGDPDDLKEWEQAGVDRVLQSPWCREHDIVARSDAYKSGAITVWIHQGERCRRFAALLRSYAEKGFRIIIVAHSNGTIVARNGMALAGWPRVEQAHFVCGACDSDFQRTGLNKAIHNNRIGQFYFYVAGKDWAMRIENTLFGKLDFAVPEMSQPLGLAGPRNVDPAIYSRVIHGGNEEWEDYGHSTCWDRKHFEGTMYTILKNCDGAVSSCCEFPSGFSRAPAPAANIAGWGGALTIPE